MRTSNNLIAAGICFSFFNFAAIALDGKAAPRIIDGSNVPASNFPTVGIISDAQSSFTCTGTLIAPHFVLTAAHCAVDGATGLVTMAQTDGRFLLGGVNYKTVHITANPSYKGDNSQEVEGAIDLSIWELDQDVPNVTPSPLYRTVPVVGTILTLAGYGEQGTGAKGIDGTFPARGTINTGNVPIDILTATFIKWNFASKPSPNQEADTAPGDSGGPQFIPLNGVLTVASVTSGGNDPKSKFGDRSYNTRIDLGAPWIDSIVNATPGNAPPTIQSLTASNLTPPTGVMLTFTAAASDPNNDPLSFAWDFGDGTNATTNIGSVSHTYTTAGVVTMQLTVSDGQGGLAQQSLTLTVGLKDALILKKKFMLNFANSAHDSLSFTLFNSAFVFASKNDFMSAFNGAAVSVFIDTTQIDSMTFSGTKAAGRGALTISTRQGYLNYSVRSNPDLETLLAKFGASNADVPSATVSVPLRIAVNGTRYGGMADFQYKAKAGKSGSGK